MKRSGVALAVAAGVGGAVVNLFARRAPWRRYPWYLAGLLPGVVGTELSLPVALAQGAAGGIAYRLGAGRSRLGRLGLAVAAGTAVGIADLHRSAVASTGVLERALTDAIGAGPDLPPPSPALRSRRAEFLVEADMPYGPDHAQVLDVWRGPSTAADPPVLVQVHGGSWTSGSKKDQALHLMGHLAERGWICVSVDYRLGPHHRWPSPVVDVKRALAWVRERWPTSFVAITGGSAGGHLAALAALTPNDPAFQSDDADTSVDAAALLYGVYDLTALNDDGRPGLRDFVRKVLFDEDFRDAASTWRDASPRWRITEDAPPMFVVHGDRDEIVSVNQARRFVEQARLLSRAPVGYAELPYAHHAFDLVGSTRTMATVHAITRFLETVRSGTHARFGRG